GGLKRLQPEAPEPLELGAREVSPTPLGLPQQPSELGPLGVAESTVSGPPLSIRPLAQEVDTGPGERPAASEQLRDRLRGRHPAGLPRAAWPSVTVKRSVYRAWPTITPSSESRPSAAKLLRWSSEPTPPE